MSLPQPSKRQRHAGTRTCVGCGVRVDRERFRQELVRLVLSPEEDGARAYVDLSGSSAGRGAWVHARPKCFEQACARGLARSAKGRVSADLARLSLELVDQAERRVASLIGTAARSHHAAVGSEAVCEVLRRGDASLLIVARDAAAAAKHREVALAVESGNAVCYGTKDVLGKALGRREVGVIAVIDDGLAAALRHTIALSETFACG